MRFTDKHSGKGKTWMNEQLLPSETLSPESTTKQLSKKRTLECLSNNEIQTTLASKESSLLFEDFLMCRRPQLKDSLAAPSLSYVNSSESVVASTASNKHAETVLRLPTAEELLIVEQRNRIPFVEPNFPVSSETPKFSCVKQRSTTENSTRRVRPKLNDQCRYEDCCENAEYRERGLCHRHYMKVLRLEKEARDFIGTRTVYTELEKEELECRLPLQGTVPTPILSQIHEVCSMKNCTARVRCRGLCTKHYSAARRLNEKKNVVAK